MPRRPQRIGGCPKCPPGAFQHSRESHGPAIITGAGDGRGPSWSSSLAKQAIVPALVGGVSGSRDGPGLGWAKRIPRAGRQLGCGGGNFASLVGRSLVRFVDSMYHSE
jgi:hypothetical protein